MKMIIISLISLLIFKISAYQDEPMNNVRDSYNRDNPDAIFHGFMPFWGALLFVLSGFFLVIIGLGLIGYLIGCRTPMKSREPSTDSAAPFFVIHNFSTTI